MPYHKFNRVHLLFPRIFYRLSDWPRRSFCWGGVGAGSRGEEEEEGLGCGGERERMGVGRGEWRGGRGLGGGGGVSWWGQRCHGNGSGRRGLETRDLAIHASDVSVLGVVVWEVRGQLLVL